MQRLRLSEEGGGAANPLTRFIGAYVEVFADHLVALVGGSDGENAVATAATTATHRTTEREIMVDRKERRHPVAVALTK